MRKTILILGVIAFFSTVLSAQTKYDTLQQLQSQIVKLENRNSRSSSQVKAANSNISKLEGRLSSTVDSVDVLKNELAFTNSNLKAVANKLELQMQQLSETSNSELSALNKRVSNNTQFRILAIITIALFFQYSSDGSEAG